MKGVIVLPFRAHTQNLATNDGGFCSWLSIQNDLSFLVRFFRDLFQGYLFFHLDAHLNPLIIEKARYFSED